MPNFPSVTAAGAFESTAVQNAVRSLARTELTSDLNGKSPTAHTHSISDVTGLAAALYDSGPRDLTSLIPEYVSGVCEIQRVGYWVQLTLDMLVLDAESFGTTGLLPRGWWPRKTAASYAQNASRIQVTNAGAIQFHGETVGASLLGTVSYPVGPDDRGIPTVLPGTPA